MTKEKEKLIIEVGDTMNKNRLKIILSIIVLLISFFISNKIISNVFSFVSSAILLEEEIRKIIQLVKEKKRDDQIFLFGFICFILLILGEFQILTEFLLFIKLRDFMFFMITNKKQLQIKKSLMAEKIEVSLKNDTGLIKTKWTQLQEGDVIFLEKGSICYVDGISEDDLIVENPFTHQTKELIKNEFVLSGNMVMKDAYIKVINSYKKSYYQKMLQKMEVVEEENKYTKIEKKLNICFFFLSIIVSLLLWITFKMSWRTVLLLFVTMLSLLLEKKGLETLKFIYFKTYYDILINGIYIIKKNVFDQVERIKTIVLSKTGILTSGNMKLTKIIPVYQTKEDVLKYAAYIEYNSNHPIAKALKNAYQHPIDESIIYTVETIEGKGKRAIIDGKEFYLGNRLLFQELNINVPHIDFLTPSLMLSMDGTYIGTFVFQDEIEQDYFLTASLLREEKVEKVCLISSGESEQIKKLGSHFSMNESYAELTLSDKEEILKMYEKEAPTLYIDAFQIQPNLKGCTSLTVLFDPNEEADIMMQGHDLNKLLYLRKKSKNFQKLKSKTILTFFSMKIIFFLVILFAKVTLEWISLLMLIFYFLTLYFLSKQLRG